MKFIYQESMWILDSSFPFRLRFRFTSRSGSLVFKQNSIRWIMSSINERRKTHIGRRWDSKPGDAGSASSKDRWRRGSDPAPPSADPFNRPTTHEGPEFTYVRNPKVGIHKAHRADKIVIGDAHSWFSKQPDPKILEDIMTYKN